MIRLSLEIGGTDRQANLIIALPMQPGLAPVKKPTSKVPDWSKHFKAAVMDAPARLDAVLHRLRLPLAVATNLQVGQVLPLTGCTVGAVRLVDPEGQVVARAKLGQIAGQIAVRIQELDDLEMSELPDAAIPPSAKVAQLVSPTGEGATESVAG